ncbi:hypothetical protein MCOR27_008246 [Pyricularia oryzae]|uniref:Fms interacting protein n=2 Tax=Pyricularia TaxID=48558 RepID=A0ABQ8P231_PYRGI|nr:hypothetical protein MCOR01_002205 [Pyricularia oryzae]KAI6304899.1 hypothetical protein MCOR33_000022 [Pyricularia grisea]KAH9429211.1 hypothetical protein MCOR02_010620 [Pyricularia oryzae]KAI6262762.1 hypothetical protein MCOR19_001102 [Pyricularia oryzae]KAI6272647.1 hypothetical protein MCOR27_008246 [Pyricularia oryzae]
MDDIVTDQNLRSVLQISQDARDQALALVDLIAQQQQQQQNGAGDDGAAHVALAKLQKQLMTNLSHLRGLHRAAFIAARDTKAMTAEKRQEVDTLHLQLQNLYYEQRHLEGEIAACEGYDHKYRELPLIPVEEFLALKPELADRDENELMVARIEHERSERQEMENQRQDMLKRKATLIAENKKSKEKLANLDQELEKFIDAAKPIEKIFENVN